MRVRTSSGVKLIDAHSGGRSYFVDVRWSAPSCDLLGGSGKSSGVGGEAQGPSCGELRDEAPPVMKEVNLREALPPHIRLVLICVRTRKVVHGKVVVCSYTGRYNLEVVPCLQEAQKAQAVTDEGGLG